MKTIKAKKDFTFGGVFYEKSEEIVDIKDIDAINLLNEKGFIEPLTRKELNDIKKSLENKKNENKKEEK